MQRPPDENIQKYFWYINERERIREKKEAGEEPPWTDNKTLQVYRFTNIRREYDRTTKELKAIYDKHREAPHREILLNCAIYRYFGTSEFAQAIGWQKDFSPLWLIGTAKNRQESKQRVFTGAYVITNQGIKAPKEEVIVNEFIKRFYLNLPSLAAIIQSTNSWQKAMDNLRKVQGFGGTGFMAKEVLLDAMLTPVLENALDKNTWSACGPGARKGLNYLWGREPQTSLTEKQCLDEMRYLLALRYDYLEDHTRDKIYGLHDIQWNLCEYSKIRTIEGGGRGKRKYAVDG